MSQLAVTVVVPTYRRPDALTRLARALIAQVDAPPHEVLVVDNDPAASARERVTRELPAARYVVEPRPGAVHARNSGFAAASGEVVVMVDDDVVPRPDWLARLCEPILLDRADVVGGRVVLDPSVARPAWFDESGIGGYLTAFDPTPSGRSLADREYIVTANAACRRDLLLHIGGMQADLGPKGDVHYVGDDVRLSRDLVACGARACYVPDAVVVHELPAERMRRRWVLRRAYLQGRSDWRVDREELKTRRWNGARVAVGWLGVELRRRGAQGWGSSATRFHAACDVARTVGALREAASWREYR